jgi:glutathione peroxidase
MKNIFFTFIMILITVNFINAQTNRGENMDKSIYEFQVKTIDGKEITLEEYKGKTMLIVNVASKCGFTKQYKGLQELFEKYKESDFVILGFPCNQFGNQEPGSNDEIKEFCSVNYDVTFPMFDKIDVNGDDAHPLYKFLKDKAPGALGTKSIKWNFTKFLVDDEGNVIERFGSAKTPEELNPIIANQLNK